MINIIKQIELLIINVCVLIYKIYGISNTFKIKNLSFIKNVGIKKIPLKIGVITQQVSGPVLVNCPTHISKKTSGIPISNNDTM